MKKTGINQDRGFTIIEMMVSLALFTIVITIAAGAFLSLIGGSGKLQGEQSVMTSLSFAMDVMTREIRTGTRYYCGSEGADNIVAPDTKDCPATGSVSTSGSTALSFVEAGISLTKVTGNRISYSYEAGSILRRIEGVSAGQSIFSSDVKLKNARFFVTGTSPLSAGTDTLQPTVTIILEATDPNDISTNPRVYTLETTVTQRELDL